MSHDMSAEEIRDKIDAKLIRMGNQIAIFFSSQDQKTAPEDVAEHINKFWEPRMRSQFFALAEQSTDSFHDLLKSAIPFVNRPKEVSQR